MMFDKNFLEKCLRAVNEGTKIFNDEFINKLKEELPNGTTYYKKEKWENGNLIDKEEKKWENGKLVYDDHKAIDDKKCVCKECQCDKTVGQTIDKSYERLKDENRKMKLQIEDLTKENKKLTDKVNQIKNLFN